MAEEEKKKEAAKKEAKPDKKKEAKPEEKPAEQPKEEAKEEKPAADTGASSPKKVNYVYGALLLHSAGKPVDEASLKKVVEAAGEQPDNAQVKALVSSLEGVDIDDAIKSAAVPMAAAPAAVCSWSPVAMLSLSSTGMPCIDPRTFPSALSSSILWAISSASGLSSSTELSLSMSKRWIRSR